MNTITLRLPLKGTMIDWETFKGDDNDPITVYGIQEFITTWIAANGELNTDGKLSWPSAIPKEERGVRIRLAWIDYEFGVAEVNVSGPDVYITALQDQMRNITPDQVAAEYSVVRRMKKPDNVILTKRGKFGSLRQPPDDEDIGKPNTF